MVLIVGHAVIELPSGQTLIAKTDVVVVQYSPLRTAFVVQDDGIEADPVALWGHVQLADGVCLIAGVVGRWSG